MLHMEQKAVPEHEVAIQLYNWKLWLKNVPFLTHGDTYMRLNSAMGLLSFPCANRKSELT